jgi:protein phosphatase 1L
MDDELEDKVISQTFQTYMKFFSKILILPSPFVNSNLWSIMKIYLLRPEVLVFVGVIFVFVLYLQVWTTDMLPKISLGFSRPKSSSKNPKQVGNQFRGPYWQEKKLVSSVFAIQGRRPKMEDR